MIGTGMRQSIATLVSSHAADVQSVISIFMQSIKSSDVRPQRQIFLNVVKSSHSINIILDVIVESYTLFLHG